MSLEPPQFVLPSDAPTITVGLEPAYNAINSMSSLPFAENNIGIADWLLTTRAALPDSLVEAAQIVFGGITVEAVAGAVPYGAATTSFPDFLAALEVVDPVTMRDRMLARLAHSARTRVHADTAGTVEAEARVPARLLADYDYYLALAPEEGPKGDLIRPLLSDAHALLNAPAELKTLLLDTLGALWHDYMAEEWARLEPVLADAVSVLEQLDLGGRPMFETLRMVTGRDLSSVLDGDALATFRHIRLIPSRHNGPYITFFGDDELVCLLFGARIPAAARRGRSALDEAELADRFKVLGDETRLAILDALREHGELGTQQIIDLFELDKSAASRHLRSLHAVGLIDQTRDAGGRGKIYSLSPDGFAALVDALRRFMPQTAPR